MAAMDNHPSETSRNEIAGFPSREGWVVDMIRDRDYFRNKQQVLRLCLLGVFVDDRNFDIHEVERKVNLVWKTKHIVTVQPHDNMYLFSFEDEKDKRSVNEQNPWSIFGAFLVLQEWLPLMSSTDKKIGAVDIWVQAHRLPMDLLDDRMTATLGPYGGTVLDFDTIPQGNLLPPTSYLHFKVEIYMCEPLVAGVFVPTGDGNVVWVEFRYEKICRLCIRYGRIGHLEENCEMPMYQVEASIQSRLERAKQLEWEPKIAQKYLPMYATGIICDIDLHSNGNHMFKTFAEDRPGCQPTFNSPTSTNKPLLDRPPSGYVGCLYAYSPPRTASAPQGFHPLLFRPHSDGSSQGST